MGSLQDALWLTATWIDQKIDWIEKFLLNLGDALCHQANSNQNIYRIKEITVYKFYTCYHWSYKSKEWINSTDVKNTLIQCKEKMKTILLFQFCRKFRWLASVFITFFVVSIRSYYYIALKEDRRSNYC